MACEAWENCAAMCWRRIRAGRRGNCCCTNWRSGRFAHRTCARRGSWRGWNSPSKAGACALVGAGPGDPELLTVKAVRLIERADVVLHDDLVPQAILDLASAAAEIVNVGKRCGMKTTTQDEINALMVDHARGIAWWCG